MSFSGQANLRLENYVYTVESFQDAGRLLAPGDDGYREAPEKIEAWREGRASVDDWPYLYLSAPTIAPIYIKLFSIVTALILLAFLVLRRVHPVRGLHANFLFLGLGFTLMEAAAIVRLALVLGSTWTVNALVFASVLLTMFIANLVVLKGKAPSLNFSWIGLGSSLLLNYLLPLQLILEVESPAREICAALLIAAPVFFAAVCFSRLFSKEKSDRFRSWDKSSGGDGRRASGVPFDVDRNAKYLARRTFHILHGLDNDSRSATRCRSALSENVPLPAVFSAEGDIRAILQLVLTSSARGKHAGHFPHLQIIRKFGHRPLFAFRW